MAIFHSTKDVHPRERLSYWRDVAMAIVPHDFHSSAGASFMGAVRSNLLGELIVSEFDCDPCEVVRTARHISQADSNDLFLCIQLSGRAVLTQDGHQVVTEKGSFLLLDLRRPHSISYQGQTRSVTLKLPRRALDARLGDPGHLTAQVMVASRPLAGLTSAFLSMLPARIEALGNPACSKLAEQALDLIALAFSAEVGRAGTTLSSARSSALFRLKSVIEAHLREPDLKPAAVAAEAGLSVRYGNALLSEEGFSLERYIMRRRLERCRLALEDPRQAHRMIGEIAFGWGFSDLSHFGRRFRAEFGFSPSDYRVRMQEVAPGNGPEQVARRRHGERQSDYASMAEWAK